MGIIPLVITNMRLISILFALMGAVANAKKVTNGVNIEIKCIEMPKRRERVAWPDQPKETILDFEKLETLKKNLETKNAAIKKQQKPATILNLDQLKERFSSKLAADFKDFSMADMKKRKKMMMFMKN